MISFLRKNLVAWIILLWTVLSGFASSEKIIPVETNRTALVYTVDAQERLVFQYYGKLVSDVSSFAQRKFPTLYNTARDYSYDGYPAFGYGNINEPALSLVHADGSISTELVYESHRIEQTSPNVTHNIIRLKDRVYNLNVVLHLESYKKEDVITQWAEIVNGEGAPVVLNNFFSSFVNLRAQSYFLTHFHGAWANEMTLTEEELGTGIKVIESKKGVRTTQSDNSAFILSLNKPSDENTGECYGGALAWSGNYKMTFQVDEWNSLNILGGINPFMSAYHLSPGEKLETPKMVWSYSASGRGQISRNLHDWARRYSLVDGMTPRPVVLNSWEGAYFSFDEAVLTEMMDDAARFGIEMFVLDDGWFGNKYPRNDATAGLGDWQTNKAKLPRGINYLVDYAAAKGLKFGLWIEPEMVNPKSVLAEKHPEWIVQSPGREKHLLRNQLLLDLANPAVQDFIWNTIDSILIASPGIAYLKWDANRHVENVGSTFLAADRQTHFWIDYTKGLYSIYEKIRAKYPKLMLQVCASGGGRLDFGSLKYHHEFWTSDDTDPMRRLYIQYATNLIYPPVASAAHVSTSPNHQTGVDSPLKFRFDVAMTGRLGMELQPKDIKGADSLFAVNAIKTYKEIRPLVASGDLYRLISPYEKGGWASLMYVSKDKKAGVAFAFSTELHNRGQFLTVKLNGLDPAKKYKIEEINCGNKLYFWGNKQVFTGEYLMNAGIDLTLSKQFDSAVFKLTTSD